MSSSPTPYVVTLYIHPDKGPVRDMQLDMLSIETRVIGLDANSDRDDARVREIAAQIKKNFPHVDPYRNIGMLNQFITRFGHVALFNGVVLRLPGTIDGDGFVPVLNPTAAEFQRLTEEMNQLKDQLEDLKKKYYVDVGDFRSAVAENEGLRKAQTELQKKLNELRSQIDKAEHQAYDAEQAAQKYKDRSGILEKEVAELRVKEEKARRDLQSLMNIQQEVAVLRQNLNEEQKAEQQLRQSLEKREKEISELRKKLRILGEAKDHVQDQAADPWLEP